MTAKALVQEKTRDQAMLRLEMQEKVLSTSMTEEPLQRKIERGRSIDEI